MYHCTKFELIWRTSDFGTKFTYKNLNDKNVGKINIKFKIRIQQCIFSKFAQKRTSGRVLGQTQPDNNIFYVKSTAIWPVLGVSRWFQVVSGWFQVISGGLDDSRWFQVVPCFSKYGFLKSTSCVIDNYKKIYIFNKSKTDLNELKSLHSVWIEKRRGKTGNIQQLSVS